MPGSMRRFSEVQENPPSRRDATGRRHSNASVTSLPDPTHERQLSQENTEYIPTQITKVAAPKPAANPLQFIKVGPASLYISAQEQLKNIEDIKKVTKEDRDEPEDWQSNLDNWKSSRRKRQEHIIERVVEVKKFEMEDCNRNRRRSKTFSEMMEEQNTRGRKANLVLYTDNDANDLSDLGTGASGKSNTNEEFGHDIYQKGEEGETDRCLHVNQNGKQGKNVHCYDDGSSVMTVSSPQPEEYTYERAIHGYVNFAETRVKSRTPVKISNLSNSKNQLEKSNTSESGTAKLSNGHSAKELSSPPHTPQRQPQTQIEEKLSALEKRKSNCTEINSSVNNDKEITIAKGDVFKRSEMFERVCELSKQISKPARRLSENNQQRLSHSVSKGEVISFKVKASQMSSDNDGRNDSVLLRHQFSNGDMSSAASLQERLLQLEKRGKEKDQVLEDLSQSVTKQLSNPDSAYGKGDSRNLTPDRDSTLQMKLANFSIEENILNGIGGIQGLGVGSVRSSSPLDDILYENKRQQFHRSLGSLDVEGSGDVCNDFFGRVQIFKDLVCCSHAASASSTEMLVFSSQSGDTDRDDSGIHTADVSCSVSQSDEPLDDGEIVATINSVVPCLETSNTGMDVYHLEVEIVNLKHVGGTVINEKLPVQDPSDKLTVDPMDVATAFLDVKDNLVSPPILITKISMLQTPETRNNSKPKQLKQETVFLNDRVESGEHVYFESYNIQQAPSDNSVLNVSVESITQEENNVFRNCNNVWQLPSSENISQYEPSDMKEEEKSLPVLSSSLPDDTEDVFLSVNASQQIPQLNLSSDVEIVSGLSFPLGPPTSTEPPKEKPPPPPAEISDDELSPVTNLKWVDSTKRIKKELRRKRSDFLGIEGENDDSSLEPELKVAPPPDMTIFLVEERRSEQQLYRQSVCSEMDSNHGETSRDSGVEVDRPHSDDWPGKLTPQVLSAQHSRQNSDIYGTASVTSKEDKIMKKEKEILEILEKEEQWMYRSNTNSGEKGSDKKLAVKLHQLEQENLRLEQKTLEEENKTQMKENACSEEDLRLTPKEQELKQQEDALQADQERLQRENKELQIQKEKLQCHEGQQLWHTHSQMHQLWGSTIALPQQWTNKSTGLLPTYLSLQDISRVPTGNINSYNPPTSLMAQSSTPLNCRLSLPDLQQEEQLQSQQFLLRTSCTMSAAPHRPPPPIPPPKPLRAVSREQRERENSIRNSRMPSADSVPQHVESTHVHHSSIPGYNGAQPLRRWTLQALSAVPRSRFISNDMWMQGKKEPDNQRSGGRESAYNYQHWLIQEAEQHQITEQKQRTAVTSRKTSPSHLYPNTPSWNTLQPQPRQEKPLPDAIIKTLTQRVQNRVGMLDSKSCDCPRRRDLQSQTPAAGHIPNNASSPSSNSATACGDSQEKILSVSGKKKCSLCGEELGRGAAMIIESLRLFYHIDCFKCSVCHVQLGDGLMGTDVRVRNNKLHCHNCYSSDDGVKFSCV